MHGRLLSSDPKRRDPAPDYVWDWRKVSSWRGEIRKIVRAVCVDGRTDVHIRRKDIEWYHREEIGRLVMRRYVAIRSYHGCRPLRLSNYYRQGLRVSDFRRALRRARSVFLTDEFPEVTETDLQRAIKFVGARDSPDGKIWFTANEHFLIDVCGHYMLYGGESVTGIAAGFGKYPDYRQKLKAFGTPTVFVCDVPIVMVDETYFPSIIDQAIDVAITRRFDVAEDVGFSISEPLRPSFFVGHYHPTGLRDPIAYQ